MTYCTSLSTAGRNASAIVPLPALASAAAIVVSTASPCTAREFAAWRLNPSWSLGRWNAPTPAK
jgi:hypothetical protein